jgi:hypothetical protein
MNKEMIDELKKVMCYTEETKCCSSCISFQAANGSMMIGGAQPIAHGNQCAYNAVAIPVSNGGCCEFFTERNPRGVFCDKRDN